MIAFHVIVFVHGHNSNGFIRPLIRNSDRQMQLKPISPEDTPTSYSLQLLSVCQKLQKINQNCEHTEVSQELNCLYFHLLLCITILELKCLSLVPLSIDHPCFYQWNSIIVSQFTIRKQELVLRTIVKTKLKSMYKDTKI